MGLLLDVQSIDSSGKDVYPPLAGEADGDDLATHAFLDTMEGYCKYEFY